MRIAVFDDDRVGLVEGDQIFDVTSAVPAGPAWPPVFMNRLIREWDQRQAQVLTARATATPRALADVALRAPVPAPLQIAAAPTNYARHIEEMGALGSGVSMRKLGFFIKAPASITGPGGPVILPKGSARQFHHECELAVVIGRTCRDVPAADALAYIFGYTCLMDITMRVTPASKEERVMRKSFDTFTPIGPWIVTADEIPDPQDLSMTLQVNGELRQQATTRDMIVSVVEQIALVSSVMTLQPGDIIATGTPAGVGPITPGDVVRIDIERVGAFEVDVQEAESYAPVRF